MEQLPLEVVEKILLKLHPSDRLDTALTCRGWAQAVSSPELLEDVWLHTYDAKMRTLVESQRQYRNLRIFGASLDRFDRDLWTGVCSHVRRLKFIRCKFTPDSLYSLLKCCPKLESLEINGYSEDKPKPPSETLLKPTESTCLDTVRESLRNVRHFRTDLTLSQEVLDLLLEIMPNATSLSLKYAIGFNRTFRNPCTLRTNRMLTKLEISSAHLPEENLIEVIQMSAGSLQDLRLYHYFELTDAAQSAIGDCTKLRHFYLNSANSLNNSHLEKLVRNSPDLESLELQPCDSLTDAGLAHIHILQRLRHLGLSYYGSHNITRNALRRLGGITTLQSLDLHGAPVDCSVLKSIANLKALKRLRSFATVNRNGFDMICRSFEKLEELCLTCARLTDHDIVKIRFLKNLKKIAFDFCTKMTDRGFEEGIGLLALEDVHIHDCRVTDVGLASINAHHGRLRKLELLHCSNITDAGLLTLLRREPFLEKLSVCDCVSVTNTCARELENMCPRLEFLKFDLNKQGRKIFRKRRPSVFVRSPYGEQ